jgi:CBS domain containing-hemolysin-like protein
LLLDADSALKIESASSPVVLPQPRLSVDERTVAHLLIAHDQIVTVPTGATPTDVEHVAASTGFSRLPTTGADQPHRPPAPQGCS